MLKLNFDYFRDAHSQRPALEIHEFDPNSCLVNFHESHHKTSGFIPSKSDRFRFDSVARTYLSNLLDLGYYNTTYALPPENMLGASIDRLKKVIDSEERIYSEEEPNDEG